LWIVAIAGTAVLVYSIVQTVSSHALELTTSFKLMFYSLVFIGCASVLAVFILVQMVLTSFVNATPFIMANVRRFRAIAVLLLVISVVYVVNIVSNPDFGRLQIITIDTKGVHTDMEFIIFIFFSLAFYVIAKVFEQAVKNKEEIDLTI
jgi:hypothetical protein